MANAAAFASVRTDRWNYVTPVHRAETSEVLFDLQADPEESENTAPSHPDVVCELRGKIEAVVGQPLPARLNEVCDPAPPPMVEFQRCRARLPR